MLSCIMIYLSSSNYEQVLEDSTNILYTKLLTQCRIGWKMYECTPSLSYRQINRPLHLIAAMWEYV